MRKGVIIGCIAAFVIIGGERALAAISRAGYWPAYDPSWVSRVVTIQADGTLAWQAGPIGATGVAGAKGATGPTGVAGTNGSNGAAGPTGPTGAQGTAGTKGATGPTGPFPVVVGLSVDTTLTSADNGNIFYNSINSTVRGVGLPAASAGLHFGFVSYNTLDALYVTAPSGNILNIGPSTTPYAQVVAGYTVGPGTFWVEAMDLTTWRVTVKDGNIVGFDSIGNTYQFATVPGFSGNSDADKWLHITVSGALEFDPLPTISGPTGPTGTAGVKGATGATGANGTNGATGPTGPQGIQGPTGAVSGSGSTGPTGATGPWGALVSLTTNTVLNSTWFGVRINNTGAAAPTGIVITLPTGATIATGWIIQVRVTTDGSKVRLQAQSTDSVQVGTFNNDHAYATALTSSCTVEYEGAGLFMLVDYSGGWNGN